MSHTKCNFYITYMHFIDTCIVYMCMQLLHVYVTVKKNSSDIVAVENILVLRLCCDLMMAWTMRRNGVI
jgi:hypothetical protein